MVLRFLFFFIFVFSYSSYSFAEIIINSPKQPSGVNIGDEMTVSMTASDPYNIKTAFISLYKNDDPVKNIIDFGSSVTGEFSYRWVVDAPEGDNYHIYYYVVYTDDSIATNTSQVFSISSTAPINVPEITIYKPSNGLDNVVMGDIVSLEWLVTSASSLYANTVALYQHGRNLGVIARSRQRGITEAVWQADQVPGDGYRFHFSVMDENGGFSEKYSSTFSIEDGINEDLLGMGGHLFGDPDSNGLSTQTAGFGVNSVSGNFYHEETDIAMPGIGLPFAFTRSYNSMDSGIDQFRTRVPTPLGKGWSHAYNILLRMNDTQTLAEVIWGDGRRDSFQKSGSAWQATSPGNFATLKASTDSDYTWELVLVDDDKTRLFFDSSRRLRLMTVNTGQKVQLSYQGENLSSLIDTAGRSVVFSYATINGGYRLKTISLPLGRSISFDYTPNGSLESVTDMRGNTRRYNYHNNSGLMWKIYPATVTDESNGKPELQISYDNKYRVTEQETAQTLATENSGNYSYAWDDIAKTMTYKASNAQGAVFKRNENGQVTGVKPLNRSSGVKEVVTYQASTGPQSILTRSFTDNEGLLTEFKYGDSNTPFAPTQIIPPRVNDSDTQDWQATYDSNHRITSIKDVNGLNTNIVRNAYGRPTSVAESGAGIPQTLTAETSYFSGHLNGKSSSVKDSVDGEIKIVSRTDDGQIRETQEFVLGNQSLQTLYDYDDAGRLISIKDHRGTLTCFQYDNNDNLTHLLEGVTGNCNFDKPASATVRHTFYEYDEDDRIIREVQGYGSAKPLEIRYTYDRNTRLLQQVSINNTYTSRFEYDVVGRLFKQIDTNSGREDRHYDLANGLVQIDYDNANNSQGGGNKITRYERDENGRLKYISSCSGIDQPDVSSSDCTGENVRATILYDAKDRVTSELHALVLNGTNPSAQRVTEYFYADEGRTVTIKQRASINDGAKTEKKLEYDALGNLLAITEYDDGKGIVARMEYDGEGRLTKLTDPNGLVTSYTYDRVGRPTSRSDIRGKVIWRYDDLNGVVERIEPDGSKVTNTYNRLGQLAYRTTSDGLSFTWQYNALGQIAKEIWDGQGFSGERNYTYNMLGELEKVTDSFGQDVTYAYDNAGRLKTKSYAGLSLNYSYNGLDQVKQISSPAGNFDFSYQDFTEALASVAYPNGYQTAYQRNPLGELERLTSTRSGNQLLDYQITLNATGWRKQIDPAEQPVKPTYPNQILNFTFTEQGLIDAINEKPVQYDDRGNLTSLPEPLAMSLGYDDLNRLTQEDGTVFHYDAYRNRMQATRGDQVTRYLLDMNQGLSDVLGTLDGNDALQDTFIHGPGGLLAAKGKDGNYRFAHADFNDNIVALTDASGALNSAYAYSPFGRNAGLQGDANFPFRFAGAVGAMTDPEGGIYMRARHYHSGIGQFTSADLIPGSLLRTQSLNRYAYVEGRVHNHTDPSGLRVVFGKHDSCFLTQQWSTPECTDLLFEENEYSGSVTKSRKNKTFSLNKKQKRKSIKNHRSIPKPKRKRHTLYAREIKSQRDIDRLVMYRNARKQQNSGTNYGVKKIYKTDISYISKKFLGVSRAQFKKRCSPLSTHGPTKDSICTNSSDKEKVTRRVKYGYKKELKRWQFNLERGRWDRKSDKFIVEKNAHFDVLR